MPRREVFNHPVIRVPVENIRFPKICPVCGIQTTQRTRLTASTHRHRYLRPYWDPNFRRSGKRMNPGNPETRSFIIPVCEDHKQPDDGEANYRILCTLGDSIMFSVFFFAVLIAGGDLWSGRAISTSFYVIAAIFFASLFITVYAFRPNIFRSSVRIVGFDQDFRNVWLDFKNSEYREAFITENQMTAELVWWVTKG